MIAVFEPWRRYIRKAIAILIMISLLSILVLPQERAVAATSELSFSNTGGFYSSAFQVELSSNVPDSKIYYTLNNTEPDPLKVGNGTILYEAPISIYDKSPEANIYSSLKVFGSTFQLGSNVKIPKCTVVKACAVSNTYQTPTLTNSYFIDPLKETKFNLPVFSLTTDPANLYDATKGLFVNETLQDSTVLTDYEKPLHVEYFDESGTQILNQNTGVRLHGNSTKNLPQKTLRLYAKSDYDPLNTKFNYEFFPWMKDIQGNPITSFKRLLLRLSLIHI